MRKSNKTQSILSLILSAILTMSIFTAFPITVSAVGPEAPSDLRIELMSNPLMVENITEPAFSWIMNSTNRGTLQTAYQIIVLDESGNTYWDSGKVLSNQSSGVKYVGDSLQANSSYTWMIKTWDQNDNESPWSDGTAFMTAIKNEWATTTSSIWANGTDNWAFFRKEFKTHDKPIKKVVLYATGYDPSFGRQNIYRVNLNGEFVGVGPTRTSTTVTSNDYNKSIMYNAFDITDRVSQDSTNTVGVICCSGKSRAFLAEIHIQYEDGQTDVIGTDESWKSFSDNNVFGTNRYHNRSHSWVGHTGYNEYIRGDLYPFGFDTVGFDDTTWNNSVANTNINKSLLVGYSAENMIEEIIEPVNITKHENGNWIVDYGESVWGGFIFTIDPQDESWDGSSKYVEILEGEVLYGPGTPGTNDTNIGSVKYNTAMGCDFKDRFYLLNQPQTMRMWGTHTFRYAEFIDLPEFVNEDNFTDYIQAYRFIYPSDFSVSSFDSPNETLNDIYEFCKRSIELMNCDLYVDSPNRERLPYEADAYIQMLANYATNDDFALARLSAEHMLFNPTWPMEWKLYGIKLMYEDYLNTGDSALLVKYYSSIKAALPDVLDDGFDTDTGIVTKVPGRASSSNADIFDWPSYYRKNISMTNQNVITNSFYYDAQMTLGKIAQVVGNEADANKYFETASISKAAIQNNFFDADKDCFKDSLTGPEGGKSNYSFQGNLFVTAWGAANEEQAKAAAGYMAAQGELKGGVYSSAFALPAMFRNGQGEVAVQYITGQDEYGNNTSSIQNWRHMMELGSGSTMEAFDESHDGTVSHSHPWGASPANILVDEIMGILPLSPAYETFQIKPVYTGLSYVSVSRPTIRGVIKAAYKTEESKYTLNITVPCNTTATVYLPADGVIYEGRSIISLDNAIDGIEFVGYENDGNTVIVEVGSGTYEFWVDRNLQLSTDAHNVMQDGYANITTGFATSINSNTAILNYTFDTELFEYADFHPADGVQVISKEATSDGARVVVMISDYNTQTYGSLAVHAKADAKLLNGWAIVKADVEYVAKGENDQKEIKKALASTTFTTVGDGTGEPVIPGDTNNDRVVDLIDLSNIIDWFGINTSNKDWNAKYTFFDFNNNGSIDIYDISYVAKLIK